MKDIKEILGGDYKIITSVSESNEYGYSPIVGDSFTSDTPLFIKYKESGYVDIKPIEELINTQAINVDALGREYDYSEKDYYVLCRSGWVEPTYIYRHKTDKNIYEVTEGDMRIEVTEDHSLFDSDQKKLNPKNINKDTKLEYYKKKINNCVVGFTEQRKEDGIRHGKRIAEEGGRVPLYILNAPKDVMRGFYESFMEHYRDDIQYTKTCIAGLQYLKKMAF